VSMLPKVFLSRAPDDRVAVDALQRELESLGIHTWTDDDIEPASDWGAHLRQTMKNADAVIFMVTSAAIANAYVMTEVGAAISAGKPIVPVVPANGRLPVGLPAQLRKWHFVRAGKRDARVVAEEIRDRLKNPVVA
jgi:hypothetical protein